METPLLIFLLLIAAHLTSAALPRGLPRTGNANPHSGTRFIHNRLRSLRALSQALNNNQALSENEPNSENGNEVSNDAAMEDEAMQSGDGEPALNANLADVFESSGDAGDDVSSGQQEQTDSKDKEASSEADKETSTKETEAQKDDSNTTVSKGNDTIASSTSNTTTDGSTESQQNATKEETPETTQEGTEPASPSTPKADVMNPTPDDEGVNSDAANDDATEARDEDEKGDGESPDGDAAEESEKTDDNDMKNEGTEQVTEPAEVKNTEEPDKEIANGQKVDQGVLGSSDDSNQDEAEDEEDGDEESLADEEEPPVSSTTEQTHSFLDTLRRHSRLPPILHPMLHNPSVLQGAVLPRKSHNRRAAGSPLRSPALLRYSAPGRFVGSFFNFPEGREAPLEGPLNDPSSQFQEHVAELRENLGSFSGETYQPQSVRRDGPLGLPAQGPEGHVPRFSQGPHHQFQGNHPQESKNTRFLSLMDSLRSKINVKNSQETKRSQGSGLSGFSGGLAGLKEALSNSLGQRENGPRDQESVNNLPHGNPSGRSGLTGRLAGFPGGLTGFSSGQAGQSGLPGPYQATNGRSAAQSARIQNALEQLRNLG